MDQNKFNYSPDVVKIPRPLVFNLGRQFLIRTGRMKWLIWSVFPFPMLKRQTNFITIT